MIKMKNKFITLVFIILLGGITGCTTPVAVTAPPPAPATPIAKQQTFDEFCYYLASNIGSKSDSHIDSVFDKELFLDNSLIGIDKNLPYLKDYKTVSSKLADKIFEQLDMRLKVYSDWYVHTSKGDETGGQCIVHSNFAKNGISIIEFRVSNHGQYKISNWHDYASDMLASDTVGTVTKDVFDIVINKNSPTYAQDFLPLENYMDAVKGSDVEVIWKSYNLLPEKYKNNIVYEIRLIEKTISNEKYNNMAVADLANHISLVNYSGIALYDYYINAKDFDSANKLINNLEARIGKGAILEILRAHISKSQNDTNGFYAHMLGALNYKYSYEHIYWSLLDQFVADKDYSDAILILDILHKGFGYTFTSNTFNNFPLYKDLIQTAEFQNWIADIQKL